MIDKPLTAATFENAFADAYPVRVGRGVKPDGWKCCGTLVASEWSEAPFRLKSFNVDRVALAARVDVTGRTVRHVNGGLAVRVKITFIGDGEPDDTAHGWMFV